MSVMLLTFLSHSLNSSKMLQGKTFANIWPISEIHIKDALQKILKTIKNLREIFKTECYNVPKYLYWESIPYFESN